MGGKANQAVSVDKYHLLLSQRYVRELSLDNPLPLLVVLTAVIVAALYRFFGTEKGSSVRATGANPHMARAQGINTSANIVLGLMLSNGLVALSGALLAQYQGSSDINMGRGAIVIGLAAVIIGEVMFGKVFRNIGARLLAVSIGARLLAVSIGAIVYYIVLQIVLQIGLNTNDLKLITALIVALFLTLSYLNLKKTAASPSAPQRKEWSSMLELKDLHKTFNPGTVNAKTALDGLSLTLRDGEFVTVIGGNGAGKSTMLNAAGTLSVDSGEVHLDGVDVTDLPEYKRAAYIGRVFQDPIMGTAPSMHIEENLALAARRGQKRGLRWGITKAERERYRALPGDLGLGLETRLSSEVSTLSGGQRQALTLLMATLKSPKLLDEHTAALDPKTAAKVMALTDRIVTKEKLTTLMITHNMRDAIQYGSRLVMLHEGRVILDISGEEKENLTVSDLLAQFARVSGDEFASDRALLS